MQTAGSIADLVRHFCAGLAADKLRCSLCFSLNSEFSSVFSTRSKWHERKMKEVRGVGSSLGKGL